MGFQRNAAQAIVTALQSNSSNGKLTESQLNTVVVDLNLTLPDLDTIDSKMFLFFKNFRDKKTFDLMKLQALGLLLGKGSLQDKAGPMFDCIPNPVQGEIDAANLRTFFMEMVSISANILPELAIEENPQPGHSLSEAACNSFVSQLEGSKELLVTELVEAMLYGLTRIRKPDFENKIRTMPVFQVLASPDRIRGVLYAKGKPKSRV